MVRQYRQIVQRRRFKIKPRILLRRVGAIVAVVAFLRVAAFALWSNILSTSPANAATPTVASITPNEGPISGGTTVTITGTGFIQGMQWKQLSAGEYHTCGIGMDDKAYCWGSNSAGQLGIGSNTPASSSTPRAVVQGAMLDNATIKQITAGNNHTCAIADNNKAYCWGNGGSGRLGNGLSSNSNSPVAVSQGVMSTATLKQISAGAAHTCAIADDDKAYCWGSNDRGQLGDDSEDDYSSTPVAVVQGDMPALAGVATVKQISAAVDSYTCAIASDDKAYCWGVNNYGQLGNNTTNNSRAPVAVAQGVMSAGDTIEQISAGYNFTCAIASNYQAYCWGENATGEMGNGSIGGQWFTPAAVSKGDMSTESTMEEISAGGHSCGIASNGRAYCWGYNGFGELGNGSTENSPLPVAVSRGQMFAGETLRGIATGVYHACAIGSYNLAYCWGNNQYGQLGNGMTANMSTTPVTMPVANPVVTVGGVECSNVSVLSDTQLTCVTPAHAAGTVDVVIAIEDQEPITLSGGFTYYDPTYISVSVDSSIVSIDGLTPNNVFGSASNTVTVKTNNPTGYTLSISTNLPSSDAHALDMKHATFEEYITGTGNACAWDDESKVLNNTTAAMAANTWGFTLNPSNLAAQQLCHIPDSDSPLDIKATRTANEIGDDTTINYGVKIDSTKPPGTYSAEVLYTVVANDAVIVDPTAPVVDVPGWDLVAVEDFTTPAPLGSFSSVYADRWEPYHGHPDTSGNGTYDPAKVLSVSDGILDWHIHTADSKHYVGAMASILEGDDRGQTYGRYSVRFRADEIPGYKLVFILWPTSDPSPNNEGEIDFPEADLLRADTMKAFLHGIDDINNNTATSDTHVSPSDTGWHVSTIEWEPGQVTYYLDDVVIGVHTTEKVPNTPFRFVLQIETNTSGSPIPDASSGHVQVDWVTIHSRP